MSICEFVYIVYLCVRKFIITSTAYTSS